MDDQEVDRHDKEDERNRLEQALEDVDPGRVHLAPPTLLPPPAGVRVTNLASALGYSPFFHTLSRKVRDAPPHSDTWKPANLLLHTSTPASTYRGIMGTSRARMS